MTPEFNEISNWLPTRDDLAPIEPGSPTAQRLIPTRTP